MKLNIENLEDRNVPSTVMITDCNAVAPHHVIAIVEADVPNYELLSWATQQFPGLENPGIRHINEDFDPRRDMSVFDGKNSVSIPYMHYNSGSDSWRDSSPANPLQVYIEEPVSGISLADQRAALDRVLAGFNGIKDAEHLYLEQTTNKAEAEILLGLFYQKPVLGSVPLAHAVMPTTNNFDGVLKVEFNSYVDWQVFDNYFPQTQVWQGNTGGVEWYMGPPEGRYGYEQVLRHELSHTLGLEHNNTLLPTATDAFYDPEAYQEMQWIDKMDLADLY